MLLGMDLAQPARLGLKENWPQFTLLVLINAFLGASLGVDRSLAPALAQGWEVGPWALSFIAAFGLSKAFVNLLSGRAAEALGRKPVLVAGWVFALPVPLLLAYWPTWTGMVIAHLFLGLSQGLAWSAAVIMKMDLAGPKQRGLALGLNEFAGYAAVGLGALATGHLLASLGPRPWPMVLALSLGLLGLLGSVLLVRESQQMVALEAPAGPIPAPLGLREAFWLVSWRHRGLQGIAQAGLVNNLNDGLAWGLFPAFFAQAKLSPASIAALIALYPFVWGLSQLATGPLSDRVGRRWPAAAGMLLQALSLAAMIWQPELWVLTLACVGLGLGTALVYPTLLAAIGDTVLPHHRATSLGVYRFWRDFGYVVGALLSGALAQWLGLAHAIATVAGLTALSGLWLAWALAPTQAPEGAAPVA